MWDGIGVMTNSEGKQVFEERAQGQRDGDEVMANSERK